MFGKKKSSEVKAKPKVELPKMETIPADFYAGANPVIEFKKVQKEVDLNKFNQKPALNSKEKQLLDKEQVAGGGQALHPSNFLTRPKFLIILALAAFTLFVVGGGFYYWYQSRSTATDNKPAASQPVVEDVVVPVEPVDTSSEGVATSTDSETATTTPDDLTSTVAINFPSVLAGYDQDLDNDGVGNQEEALFNTDPALGDSDQDGFEDSHELNHLYNPSGQEPKRLIDYTTVQRYTNPVHGYTVYYPSSWVVDNVDSNYDQVLFTSLSGENVEVRRLEKDQNLAFIDWFSDVASGERYSDLEDFTSVFEQVGKVRNDKLVYYFINQSGSDIYLIMYDTAGSDVATFRNVINMMARSFQLAENSFIKLWPEGDSSEAVATSTVTSTPDSTVTTTVDTATTSPEL